MGKNIAKTPNALKRRKRGFRVLLFRDHPPPSLLSFLKNHYFAKTLQGKDLDLLHF